MDAILPILGFFLLRLGVPILLMVLLSWGVNRYVRHEEAQERRRAMAALTAAASTRARIPQRRCWEIKGCTQTAMSKCPAARRPELPCWLARQLATGRLMATCPACEVYAAGAAAMGD